MERYAYKMQPALVKDGQKDWSAKDVFSFDYFKSVYSPDSEVILLLSLVFFKLYF